MQKKKVFCIHTQFSKDRSETRFVLRRDLFPWIIQINYSHFKQLENKGLQSTVVWYREGGPVLLKPVAQEKRWGGQTNKRSSEFRLCLLVSRYRSSAFESRLEKIHFLSNPSHDRRHGVTLQKIFTELSASATAELSAGTLNRNFCVSRFSFFFFLQQKHSWTVACRFSDLLFISAACALRWKPCWAGTHA